MTQKTDAQLGPAIARVQAECTAIENFRKELESIPAILSRIAAITSSIGERHHSFRYVGTLSSNAETRAKGKESVCRVRASCARDACTSTIDL